MEEQNKNKTILIIDKDGEMRKGLSNELAKEGYKVEIAQKLSEVLEKTLISRTSLIVVDLQTVNIPGCETISMIKKFANSIPIITITDDDSIETERKVRQEGVFFYFVKPFSPEDMKAVINSAIGAKG
jgi:two-component system OmpR family response regulator